MHQTIGYSHGVSLKDILPEGRVFGDSDIRVMSCCDDPKRCQPGDLYVALLSADDDGHNHADLAVRNGAVAVLAEQPLPVEVPVCLVPDTRMAFGHVCQALTGSPSQSVRVVGVTGSNGKTTTGVLIASILQAAGATPGIIGSLGCSDSTQIGPAPRSAVRQTELAHWLGRMRDNDCSHAVAEISSRSLAQQRLSGVQLDAAVLTNARTGNLDLHGSAMNYRRAMGRLFDHLRPGGVAVVNADDPGAKAILSEVENPLLTVGMICDADISAQVIEQHLSEQTFLLHAGSETIPVRTRMIGNHHIYNCLTAAAVGLLYGIDTATIVKGLESVDFVPGRLERIECGQPFGVFVDSANTPDRLSVALKTLRRTTEGRVICVTGAEGDRPSHLRPTIGRVLERGADMTILCNNSPRKEEPLQIIHDILDGFDRPARAHVLPDRAEAICWALQEAKPCDTVLIAGKGDCRHEIIGKKRHILDDRELVRGWLYDEAEEEIDLNN